MVAELERRKEKEKLCYEGHLQSKSKRSRRQYCSCDRGRFLSVPSKALRDRTQHKDWQQRFSPYVLGSTIIVKSDAVWLMIRNWKRILRTAELEANRVSPKIMIAEDLCCGGGTMIIACGSVQGGGPDIILVPSTLVWLKR